MICVKSLVLQSSSSSLAIWFWERLLSGLFSTEELIKLVTWSFSALKVAFSPKVKGASGERAHALVFLLQFVADPCWILAPASPFIFMPLSPSYKMGIVSLCD